MKFGREDLYKILWGKYECCENLLSDSYTSLNGVS